jgi:ubiquinone/menaquinone biosynthesis C-methylase UbiE
VKAFPGPEGLADLVREAGFREAGFRRLSFGIAAIHWGTR